MGYLLPATGTTVYVEIKGITEVTGATTIQMQYGGYVTTLSTTVTSDDTSCTAWVVGNFDGTGNNGITINCGQTGIVFYDGNSYQTNSNGGSDGGHFYGPGTGTDSSCTTTTATSTTTTTT